MAKEILTVQLLEEELRKNNIKLRHDVISDQTEITGGTALGINNKTDVAGLVTILQDYLRPNYICVTQKDIRNRLNIIIAKNRYNSFIEKIDSYPAWDETHPDRIEQLCTDVLMLPAEDWLSRVLIKKWLLQALLIANNSDESPFASISVLIFTGEQKCGKTSIARALYFNDSKYGADGMHLSKEKDTYIQAFKHAIVELGELGESIKDTNIDFLKQLFTKGTDIFRKPYAEAETTQVRRTSFIGTVNPKNEQFLVDTTGNRRYWTVPITVKKINFTALYDLCENMGDLWQQVKWLQENEYKPNYKTRTLGCELTDEEEEALAERNSRARIPIKAEAEIRDYIEYAQNCGEGWACYPVTITELQGILRGEERYQPDLRKFTNVTIGRALSVIGCKQYRNKNYRLWYIPMLTGDVSLAIKDRLIVRLDSEKSKAE